jgi:C4-dicarboxylate-binding protein DctP
LSVLAKKTAFEALQMPFLISSYDSLAKVLSSDAAMKLMDELSSASLKGISLFEGGQRNFLSAKGPVRTVEDLKGVKTRVMNMPLFLSIWRAAGAAPVGMDYGEVYTSLQTKVIDAVEINVSSLESERFWEPAKHFTYTGHYFFTGAIVYSKTKFDALPADIQKIMVDAGRAIIVPQVMQTKAEEQVVADKLKSMGVNFYQFGEIAKMRELMKPVIDDKMTKDPAIKAFVEAVRKIEAGS